MSRVRLVIECELDILKAATDLLVTLTDPSKPAAGNFIGYGWIASAVPVEGRGGVDAKLSQRAVDLLLGRTCPVCHAVYDAVGIAENHTPSCVECRCCVNCGFSGLVDTSKPEPDDDDSDSNDNEGSDD